MLLTQGNSRSQYFFFKNIQNVVFPHNLIHVADKPTYFSRVFCPERHYCAQLVCSEPSVQYTELTK